MRSEKSDNVTVVVFFPRYLENTQISDTILRSIYIFTTKMPSISKQEELFTKTIRKKQKQTDKNTNYQEKNIYMKILSENANSKKKKEIPGLCFNRISSID